MIYYSAHKTEIIIFRHKKTLVKNEKATKSDVEWKCDDSLWILIFDHGGVFTSKHRGFHSDPGSSSM